MDQQSLFSDNKRVKKKVPVVRECSPRYWSDLELLTSIVGSGSQDLLNSVDGDLYGLHINGLEQFCSVREIGPAIAQRLMAALELGRRLAQGKRPEKVSFSGPHEVAAFLMEEMRYYQKEYFKIILLNTKNRVIAVEDISVGSLNSSIVHPREVFNPAVKKSAASLILTHNHPSGDPTPSREDIDLTARLVEAGKLMGIAVLDHIVIGDGKHYSFKEGRLIQ